MSIRASASASICLTAVLTIVCALSMGDIGRSQQQQAATEADGVRAFREVASVLVSPRCINCHIAGDAPLQGDDSHRHTMEVRRGADGRGTRALRCQTCHQAKNTSIAHGPPGVEGWRLPPPEMPMAWRGLSLAGLCRELQDPKKNGGRTLPQLIKHVTDDHLVHWAWDPGPGRARPPLSHEAFVAAFTRWAGQGAPCPADSQEAR